MNPAMQLERDQEPRPRPISELQIVKAAPTE